MLSFKKIRNSIASVALAVASASCAGSPTTPLPAIPSIVERVTGNTEAKLNEQQLETRLETSSPSVLSKLEYALNMVGSYALTVGWHELGHYTMDKVMGFKNIEFHGPSFKRGEIARVSYDREPQASTWQERLSASGGFLFTTSGNLLLSQLLKRELMPASVRSFTASTSLLMLIDRHISLWGSAMQNYARAEPRNDISNLMKLSFDKQSTIDIAYGIALGASLLELYLRDKELGYLICTAFGLREGIPECRSEYFSGRSWQPAVYPIGEGVMIGVSREIF